MVAGKYELLEELGKGGMGTVYLAQDTTPTHFGRKVALKTISGTPQNAEVSRFESEIRILMGFTHPNIVTLLDSGILEEPYGVRKPFLVMELLQGKTLDSELRATQRLDKDTAVKIVEQVADGLRDAHDRNIVHRDLKPGNIFLLKYNKVKIIDFGIAQLIGTQPSSEYVTYSYAAPEVFEGKYSALSDQFSLGAVFYEILTGVRAFHGDNGEMVMRKIREDVPPIASKVQAGIPKVISQIAHKMMAKKPGDRFESMQKVLEVLDQAKRGAPITCFDPEKYKKAKQAAREFLQAKQFELAQDVLAGLDAEGYEDDESRLLKEDVGSAILAKRVAADLADAEQLLKFDNFEKARERVASVFAADKANVEARALQDQIERGAKAHSIRLLKKNAEYFVSKKDYAAARSELAQVLALDEVDPEALRTLTQIDRVTVTVKRGRELQETLFQSARSAKERWDLQTALSNAEQVLEIDGELGSDGEKSKLYRDFAKEVREKVEFRTKARTYAHAALDRGEFSPAKNACKMVLEDEPNSAEFQALSIEIEDRRQAALFDAIARVARVPGETQRLDDRVNQLRDATKQFSEVELFKELLAAALTKQNTVNRLVAKAKALAAEKRHDEAATLWATVVKADSGLMEGPAELRIVQDLADSQRAERRRTALTAEVEFYLGISECDRAEAAIQNYPTEAKGEPILKALEHRVVERRKHLAEAAQLLKQGRAARESKDWNRAIDDLRRAFQLEPKDQTASSEFAYAAFQLATIEVHSNPERTCLLAQEGLRARPGHKGLLAIMSQVGPARTAEVEDLALRGREALAHQNFDLALRCLEEGLKLDVSDPGLLALNDEISRRLQGEQGVSPTTTELFRIVQKSLEQPLLESPAGSVTDLFDVPTLDPVAIDPLAGLPEEMRPAKPQVAHLEESEGRHREVDVVVQKPSLISALKERILHNRWLSALALGLAISVVVFVAINPFRGARPDERPRLERRVKVSIPGAESVRYKVLDQQGQDVTEKLATGLTPGEYDVHALRRGFREQAHRFSISASDPETKQLNLEWEILPTRFRIKLEPFLGQLVVDGKPAVLGEKEYRSEWSDGTHTLVWMHPNRGTMLDLSFRVERGQVSVEKVDLKGSDAAGLIVTSTGDQVAYRAVNSSALMEKLDDGPSRNVKGVNSMPLKPGTAVSFETPYGNKLGTYSVREDGGSAVEVMIIPTVPTKPPPPPSLTPPPPPKPETAPLPQQPTESEVNGKRETLEEKRRRLGLEDLKKAAGKNK